MMSSYTLVFSVVILLLHATIAQSKGIKSSSIEHEGRLPVVIDKREVTNGDDEANINVDSVSLTNSKSAAQSTFDIVSDTDVDIVKNQIDQDGNATLDEGAKAEENQRRTSKDGLGNASFDEELQQDLPDVWSDTGQFLTGILEKPIRLEEDPLPSLGTKHGSASSEEGFECPPPVQLVTPSLCGAPACLTHRHCRDPDTACCFNGCVHTCLRPLDAPAVIDWLQDTSLILPMLDEAPGVPRYPMLFEGSSSIAYAQGGGEAVHLQGGCTITSQQYDQLKDYMTRTNIQDCSCTGGEVVCVVKPYKRDEE